MLRCALSACSACSDLMLLPLSNVFFSFSTKPKGQYKMYLGYVRKINKCQNDVDFGRTIPQHFRRKNTVAYVVGTSRISSIFDVQARLQMFFTIFSGNLREHYQEISWKISGNFLDISSTFPRSFRRNFQEFSGKNPETNPEICPWKCPGNVKKKFGRI